MRSFAIACLIVPSAVLSACGGGGGGSPAMPTSTAAIDIAGFKFKPATLEVKTGATLRFTNRDRAEHTATMTGGFDTGRLAKGQSKAVVLRKPGTFVYRCDFHPFMTGEVVVK
jgi:plastocyanin